MLNWDEEELAGILWDEAPETVVPYLDGNEDSHSASARKEMSKELSSNEIEIEIRVSDKPGVQGRVNESKLNTEKNLSCLGAEPWRDTDLPAGIKQIHKSMDTNLASGAGTSLNLPSPRDGAAQFDKYSEISQKQLEGNESGNFADYSWDDIGSFDELDKIFSNDDPIFGSVGLAGIDEFWSVSKDPGFSLDNYFPLQVDLLMPPCESYGNAHMHNKVRTEYTELSDQPIHDNDRKKKCMPNDTSNMTVPTDVATNSMLETKFNQTEKVAMLSSPNSSCSTLNKLSNKVNKQKKMKNRKGSDHKLKGESFLIPYHSQNHPGNQFQQFGNKDATSMMHSYPFSDHTQIRQSTDHHRQMKLSVPRVNMYNQFPQHHCGVGSLQQKLPVYKPYMTPQEKIDKLRRRQQMQAMLAIKKQQEELGHQVPGLDIDQSVSKNHFQDSQLEIIDRTENNSEETPSGHPYYDPSCSLQEEIPDDVFKVVNEFPMENSALSQLQDVIAKLDSRIRLCIRDSLFRLAKCAAQRHHPSDTLIATNNLQGEDYKLTKAKFSNHNRGDLMVDTETETNPIDRTVAHLLFHRPFDVTAKQSETPNLSASAQPIPRFKTDSFADLHVECSKDDGETKQTFSSKKESENPFFATEPQLRTEVGDSSRVGVSEKTSSHEHRTQKSLTQAF